MASATLTAEQISARYRYWRPRLMFSMIVGYGAFYLTRKSVSYAMPVMQLELGLDKGDIGLLGTLFYLAYGGSKFVSGIVSDRSQARWFMGVGLFITGVLNIVFAFCHSLTALLVSGR
ncbi:Regulatory protein uhpC [Serratia fonticola]|uniref:Regulatory protein uhpC n=1 Tax=Serratia fonticola TaxID=47917 RepID=A0A4U9TPX2_SERFO|nr:Regulatory protein uhpC [Serratia fonticola]